MSAVISNIVNNILIGDMYLSVRNAEGQEFVEIYPERLEKIYEHGVETMVNDQREDGLDYYLDEAIKSTKTKAFCRFKINGRLTHVMDVDVMPSLFNQFDRTSNIHFMPFNIKVKNGCDFGYNFDLSKVSHLSKLSEFIENAFPEIPTTCVHDYEKMKLTKDTLSGYKRLREEAFRREAEVPTTCTHDYKKTFKRDDAYDDDDNDAKPRDIDFKL